MAKKIENLSIESQNNTFHMHIECTDISSGKNASYDVAIALTRDIGRYDVPIAQWIEGHQHFDFMSSTDQAKSILRFREKNVPEGPNGKGNVLGTIPATLLRLGEISQEEYSEFVHAINTHPLVQERAQHIKSSLSRSQKEIMDEFQERVAETKARKNGLKK